MRRSRGERSYARGALSLVVRGGSTRALGDIPVVHVADDKMTRRVDFSGNAPIYDRRHGATADEGGLRQICDAARLEIGSTILDVGAGTGRVAIPLFDLGYKVTAVEPSAGMLEQLRLKADGRPIEIHLSQGSDIPAAPASFDAVAIARLLYLTPDWRLILDEAARVLKPDGVLMHEWGNGTSEEPWVLVREKARALFEEDGIASPFHPGARQQFEVEAHLTLIGFRLEKRVAIGSGPAVTVREFLRRLVDGELSYIWDVPAEVRARCLPRLQTWAQNTLNLDAEIPVPKLIEWTVYRRHAAQQELIEAVEAQVNKRKRTKLVHEGRYVAEVDVDLIQDDTAWSPCLTPAGAFKLDDVRTALRHGDLHAASHLARVLELRPVAPR